MALSIAEFRSEDGNGWVFYDTVTMYVYPVMFRTEVDAWKFNAWLVDESGAAVNAVPRSGEVYTWYERYYDTKLRDDSQTIGASPYHWVKKENGSWIIERKDR